MTGPVLQVVADVGNHATKIGVVPRNVGDGPPIGLAMAGSGFWNNSDFWRRRRIEHFRFREPGELPDLAMWPEANWLIASVNPARARQLMQHLTSHRPADNIQMLSNRDVPLHSAVDFPDRVGIDRLVAAYQARRRAPADVPVIVIDSGTAVTVDLVTADHTFRGGAIFPGIRVCFESLQRSTAQLPEIAQPALPDQICGQNTEQAIASGVLRLQIGGLRYLAESISQQLDTAPLVVMTGGAIDSIRSALPAHWLYEPNLILEGLVGLADPTSPFLPFSQR